MSTIGEITLLAALALLVVAAGPVAAGDTYIPDSNATKGYGNLYPFGTTEIRYQSILTVAQLGSKAFTITDISFAHSHASVFVAREFEVRMSHTTVPPSNMFADNLPGPVTVLEATDYKINIATKVWNPLRLSCPFRYNGADGLTIEIRFRGVSSTPNGGAFKSDGTIRRTFATGPGSFNASRGGVVDLAGYKIRITHADVTPSSATPSIGTSVNLLLASSADAGRVYVAASSFSPGSLPLGCWTVGLALDDLFFLTVLNKAPAMFQNYQGLLDAKGQARAAVWIPPIPSLVGLNVHTAFLVLDQQFRFATVSATGVFKIAR